MCDARTIDGPKIMLKPEAAQNIGLALHELATNALSYGAPVAAGRHHRARHGASTTVGSISNGARAAGRRVAMPPREGFGHKVIKRLVAQALDGEATLNFPPDGLFGRCRFRRASQ